MKTSIIQLPILFALIALAVMLLNGCSTSTERDNEENEETTPALGSDKDCCFGIERIDNYYEKNQLLVIYKNSPADSVKVRQDVLSNNINIDTVLRCNACDSYAELWKGEDIHTIIHGEGIVAGTGLRHKSVGEDTVAYYSVNYKMPLPLDHLDDSPEVPYRKIVSEINGLEQQIIEDNRDKVVIAVLDTGFDPMGTATAFLWNGTPQNEECYPNFKYGWNFVDNNENINDDNVPTRHGTVVTRFILEEFVQTNKNFPQIMPLKTHDKNGSGSLFASICAIHFAINNGADIINASWGFYDHEKIGHPYLDSLVTDVLRKEGILFVTSSGNKIDAVDNDLTNAGVVTDNLRDIKFNYFYPARLNNMGTSNMFTVTTNDVNAPSPTQNYSSLYVNMGVMSNATMNNYKAFKLPGTGRIVSGSSYATAIFTGKVAAHLNTGTFTGNINSASIISNLKNSGLVQTGPTTLGNKVRDGYYIKPR